MRLFTPRHVSLKPVVICPLGFPIQGFNVYHKSAVTGFIFKKPDETWAGETNFGAIGCTSSRNRYEAAKRVVERFNEGC